MTFSASQYIFFVSTDSELSLIRDLDAPDTYHIKELCLSYIFLKLFFKVLSIFIRALTSDINEIEAAKRSKTSKNHMEERLARGFVLLRYPTEGNLESCQIYERNSELKYFSKCLLITQKSMFKF